MTADSRFIKQPKSFWAHIRSISEQVGYTVRGKGTIKVPTLNELLVALRKLDLNTGHVSRDEVTPTMLGTQMMDYFRYRADVLNHQVEASLMDSLEAERLFKSLCKKYNRKASSLPMNKQKGKKKKCVSDRYGKHPDRGKLGRA